MKAMLDHQAKGWKLTREKEGNCVGVGEEKEIAPEKEEREKERANL